jgi:hypothetical protein
MVLGKEMTIFGVTKYAIRPMRLRTSIEAQNPDSLIHNF